MRLKLDRVYQSLSPFLCCFLSRSRAYPPPHHAPPTQANTHLLCLQRRGERNKKQMSPWTFEARAQDQGKFLADLLGTVFHFPELNLQVCQVFRFHHLRCSRLKQISSDDAHGDRRTTIEEKMRQMGKVAGNSMTAGTPCHACSRAERVPGSSRGHQCRAPLRSEPDVAS